MIDRSLIDNTVLLTHPTHSTVHLNPACIGVNAKKAIGGVMSNAVFNLSILTCISVSGIHLWKKGTQQIITSSNL